MHDVIRNGLEGYLSRRLAPEGLADFRAHLAGCAECRDAVGAFERQSALIRTLRVPGEELAPAPGFYARVLERIDAQRPVSLWSVFLQPLFARSLALATLALFLFLGSSLLSMDESHEVFASESNPVGVLAGYGVQPETEGGVAAAPHASKDMVMEAVLSDSPVHLVSVSQ
jgi:anti-sigma factor RsiW